MFQTSPQYGIRTEKPCNDLSLPPGCGRTFVEHSLVVCCAIHVDVAATVLLLQNLAQILKPSLKLWSVKVPMVVIVIPIDSLESRVPHLNRLLHEFASRNISVCSNDTTRNDTHSTMHNVRLEMRGHSLEVLHTLVLFQFYRISLSRTSTTSCQ